MNGTYKYLFALICFSTQAFSSKLSVGVLGEFRPNHPYLASSDGNAIANSFVLLPLISLEKGWQWKCRLCTQVPSQANRGIDIFTDKTGVQKLAVHFELSENTWGDGQAVNLKDIAFTWELIKHLPPNSRAAIALQDIEEVVIRPKETRHFTILMRSILDPYPVLNSFYVVSEHLEQAVVDKDKTWNTYFANSLYVKEPLHKGLYNGPFALQSREDNRVRFVKNASSQHAAKMESLEVSFFPTLDDLSKALHSAKIDGGLELSVWNDTLSLLDSLKKEGKNVQAMRDDGLYYEHLDFNLQNPFFQDGRVRRALAHGFDKEVILQQIVQNWAIPAVSPIHPGNPYFSENVSFYKYSKVQARKLLADSDWQVGANGYCSKKNRTLAFEILTIDDPLRVKIANYLVKAWKEIGAQVTVRALPLYEFREKIAKRHFSGLALYSWKLPLFQNTRYLFHSSAIPSLNNAYSGQNIAGWINARVDESLTKFANTLGATERKHQLEIFQKEYTREVPGIPLFFRTQMSIIPNDLKSFELSPSYVGLGLAAGNWQVTR